MDIRGKSSNEKRLIDADALWRKFESEPWYDNADRDEIALPLVDEAQTVDAVEVVRCRECKYHYWEQEPCHGKSVHYCNLPHMRGVEVFKEFFCYYGERKEGAE